MLFNWLLVAILKFSTVLGDIEYRRVIRQAGSNTCIDPDNRPGLCVEIRSCQPLLELLTNRGRESAVVNFLRQSQCATAINNQPQVCCSSTAGTPPSLQLHNQSPSTQKTTTNQYQTINTDYSQCGISHKRTTRLPEGHNPYLGDWPWMAALGYRTASNQSIQFKCGGSLISNRWIVTAAHCVQNIGNLTLTTVRLGDLDLKDDNPDGATPLDFTVDQIISHPDYIATQIQNDIALIKLKELVTFTKNIRAICLLGGAQYLGDGFYSKKVPFIPGWGASQLRSPTRTYLQDAQIEIVENQICARNYSDQGSAVIDQRVLCAGRDGKQTCQSDSGGPLIIPQLISQAPNHIRRPYYHLAGVASITYCDETAYPGVYTRVAYFADWIRNTARIGTVLL